MTYEKADPKLPDVVTLQDGAGGSTHLLNLAPHHDVLNSPYYELVHSSLQGAISQQPPIGISTAVGVPRENADRQMRAQNLSPEEFGERFLDVAIAKWANEAKQHQRLGFTSYVDVEPEHGEVAVTQIDAVVFTDELFGRFILDVEAAMVQAVTAAVAAAKSGGTLVVADAGHKPS